MLRDLALHFPEFARHSMELANQIPGFCNPSAAAQLADLPASGIYAPPSERGSPNAGHHRTPRCNSRRLGAVGAGLVHLLKRLVFGRIWRRDSYGEYVALWAAGVGRRCPL